MGRNGVDGHEGMGDASGTADAGDGDGGGGDASVTLMVEEEHRQEAFRRLCLQSPRL